MRGPRDTSRIIGGGAYIVDPRHFTCHVTGYGVRAFPVPREGGTGTRPGCTPAYAGHGHDRENELDADTAAEHRRLGLVTRSSPYRQPHPTFREGGQGERAI